MVLSHAMDQVWANGVACVEWFCISMLVVCLLCWVALSLVVVMWTHAYVCLSHDKGSRTIAATLFLTLTYSMNNNEDSTVWRR
jgi:hypothetical protein